MATRRALAGAFQGAQDAFNTVFGLRQRRLEDERNFEQNLSAQALQNPRVADALRASGRSLPGLDLQKVGTQPSDIVNSLSEAIANIKDLRELPTESSIRGRAEGEFGRIGAFQQPDVGPPDVRGEEFIQSLTNQLGQKRGQLDSLDLQRVKSIDPDSLAPTETFLPTSQLANQTFQSDLTPQQQGRAFQTEQRSGALNPRFIEETVVPAEVAKQTGVEEGTRQNIVERAGEVSGAQSRARFAEQFSPQNMQAQLELARASAAIQPPTAGETDKAAQANILAHADAKSTLLEEEGATIGSLGLSIMQSPTLRGAEAMLDFLPGMDFVDDKEAAYIQSALEFVGTYGKIISGVAIREDEIDRFISTFFAMPGDSPELIQTKSDSRAAALGAARMASGRAGRSGGAAFANQIMSGKIVPPDRIQSFIAAIDFTANPEFEAGFLSVVGGQ